MVLFLVRVRRGSQRIPMPRTKNKSHRKCETGGRAQGTWCMHEGRAQDVTGWYGGAAWVHPGETIKQAIVVHTTTRTIQTDATRRRPAAAVSTTTTTTAWWTMGPNTTTAATWGTMGPTTAIAATAAAVGTEQSAATMGATTPTGTQQLATTMAQMTVRGNAG